MEAQALGCAFGKGFVQQIKGVYVERLVIFEVLGQEYPLYTDAPEGDVQEILDLVKSQLEAHSKSMTYGLPSNKIAILASLNMAGKYVRLKREFENFKQSINVQNERLADKIESSLF